MSRSNTPLNQWDSGRYIMAEDGATISVEGYTLVTPDGRIAFFDVESARAAADLYIAGRRREWEDDWLIGGWKRLPGSSTYIKTGAHGSIHVQGPYVTVLYGDVEYDNPTLSAALESVNSGRYEKPDQKPRPARLEVGQVWRFPDGHERMVTARAKRPTQWDVMGLGDDGAILDYGGAEYVGKVTIK